MDKTIDEIFGDKPEPILPLVFRLLIWVAIFIISLPLFLSALVSVGVAMQTPLWLIPIWLIIILSFLLGCGFVIAHVDTFLFREIRFMLDKWKEAKNK